jgi:hypothetical protein
VTPGSTAPDASLTEPVIDAWDHAIAGAHIITASRDNTLTNDFIRRLRCDRDVYPGQVRREKYFFDAR